MNQEYYVKDYSSTASYSQLEFTAQYSHQETCEDENMTNTVLEHEITILSM